MKQNLGPVDTRSLDERFMFMNKDIGFYVTVQTHGAGEYEKLERDFPSRYGHWQITSHRGEHAECTGFMLRLEPKHYLAMDGFHPILGSVFATLHDCLDEAERRIRAQGKRIGPPDRWPTGWADK